jgi:hypothetical protein
LKEIQRNRRGGRMQKLNRKKKMSTESNFYRDTVGKYKVMEQQKKHEKEAIVNYKNIANLRRLRL